MDYINLLPYDIEENWTQLKCSSINQSQKSAKITKPVGLISTILIVLLPKCSLCFMAYSSTLALCSGRSLLIDLDYRGLAIMMILTILTYRGIWRNLRGRRTYQSMGLAGLGFILVYFSFFNFIAAFWHYPGSVIVLLAIWVNGSFYYSVNRIKNIKLNHKQTNTI